MIHKVKEWPVLKFKQLEEGRRNLGRTVALNPNRILNSWQNNFFSFQNIRQHENILGNINQSGIIKTITIMIVYKSVE